MGLAHPALYQILASPMANSTVGNTQQSQALQKAALLPELFPLQTREAYLGPQSDCDDKLHSYYTVTPRTSFAIAIA